MLPATARHEPQPIDDGAIRIHRRLVSRSGFTLLEMVITFAIAGLLAGGGLLLFKAEVEHRLREQNRQYMAEVQQAIRAFAKANRRFPFADHIATSDGLENHVGLTPQSTRWGYLPFATLGVPPTDASGNKLKYAVTGKLNPAGADACSSTAGIPTVLTALPADNWGGDWVKVRDSAVSSTPFYVGAILVSGGGRNMYGNDDASQPKTLDGLPTGEHNKSTGYGVSFVKDQSIDDLVIYIDPATAFDWLGCGGPSSPGM